jgi:hypothetical protein
MPDEKPSGHRQQPPTIVRDPELAFVLAELQKNRSGLDRIEEHLTKPPAITAIPHRRHKSWWRR